MAYAKQGKKRDLFHNLVLQLNTQKEADGSLFKPIYCVSTVFFSTDREPALFKSRGQVDLQQQS